MKGKSTPQIPKEKLNCECYGCGTISHKVEAKDYGPGECFVEHCDHCESYQTHEVQE